MVQFWGGRQESTLMVHKAKLPSPSAAFANSAMAHACAWDPFYDSGVVRPVVAVIPAAMAVAEAAEKTSGKDLLCAVTLGMELICQIADSMKVSPRYNGWIYSSVIGIFGAAAAVGKILRLDRGAISHCLGIAYAHASGNHQATLDGVLTKRLQPGIAAKNGVLSGYLAAKGVTGAKNYLSGKDGLCKVYFHDEVEPGKIVRDLGSTHRIRDISFNRYPCGRLVHTSLDSIFEITSRQALDYRDIQSIRVYVTKETYEATCQPLGDKRVPGNIIEAQFSIPYTIALALVRGMDGIQRLDRYSLDDPVIRELSAKIDPVLDWDLERAYPRGITPAIVEVETRGGVQYSARTDHPMGHPHNPVHAGAYHEKLETALRHSGIKTLSDAGKRIISIVNDLESCDDVRAFVNDVSSVFVD